MRRISRTIERIFYHTTKKDWDAPYAIVGDEGKSKSNLGMHLIDKWYMLLNGQCNEDDVKHLCLDREQFSLDFKDLKQYEATDYDETDLSNKRTMSSYNYILSKTFQVVRGENLFIILTLPSIFDLDGFFSKRRLKGLFVVYARGKVAFYNQSRLRRIIAYNQNRMIKTTKVVPPLYYDTFPKYKGVLLDGYLEKKNDKMKQIREDMYNEINKEEKGDRIDTAIKNLKDKGFTDKEIGGIVGMTQQGINYRIKKQKTTQLYKA